MIYSTKTIAAIALLLLLNQAGTTQTAFDLSAQLIARPELRSGYRTLPPPGAGIAFFTSQRTRLNAAFTNEYVKIGLSLQDVRVWGEEPQLADIASFGLHEGWAEVNLGKHTALKVGRQELVYDDQRLFGNNDWEGQGSSHDAAVLKIKYAKSAFHFGAAFNQASARLFGQSDPVGTYKALGWLWYNRKFAGEKFELSLYGITDAFPADVSLHRNTTFFRGTAGPMLHFTSGKFKASTTFFGQFGKDNSDANISAFLGAASFGYTVSNKFDITIGYDYISGNKALRTPATENHSFSTLYGSSHMFYGFMDYFLNLPKDTRSGGLQNAYLKWNISASPRTTIGLDAHYFLLANRVKTDENYLANYPLGLELDFTAIHRVNAFAKVQFGFSAMFGHSSLEALNKVSGGSADKPGIWGYIMLIVHPSLLKVEK
ncbi:MAG: alginate export family protein [Saprospirales bacterium]|nr:alginate export family protein [Saprospirales bacterium]